MKWFRSSIILFLIVVSFHQGHSQFGVRAFYGNQAMGSFDELDLVPNYNQIEPTSHVSLQLDYWLRLQNYRVEFYPYLGYDRYALTYTGSVNDLDLRSNGQGIAGGIITHIYPFDLQGDCDCPTFSKQSGFFKKGFFLMGGVGGQFLSFKAPDNANTETGQEANLQLQLGLGIDIGVSDLITLSPIIRYNIHPSFQWNDPDISDFISSKTISQLQFGIRVGFRADYHN